MTKVRLDTFDARKGCDRGASSIKEMGWYACKCLFFLSPLPWPSDWKVALLRAFGAVIGENVVIKPRVNIHFPWKIAIGDHSWLGEELFILNFEPVRIGTQCCLSQRAFLCTGNHDYRDPAFSYRNAPICLGDGVWIGAQAFVGPGVTVGTDAVVTACSRVVSDLPPNMICDGSPAVPVRMRWPS